MAKSPIALFSAPAAFTKPRSPDGTGLLNKFYGTTLDQLTANTTVAAGPKISDLTYGSFSTSKTV
jgi:hypothetical protein